MDPQKVKDLVDFKLRNVYPPNSTKNQRSQTTNCIFVAFHVSAFGTYCGVDKTMHAIIQNFYWPGIKVRQGQKMANDFGGMVCLLFF